MSSTTQPLTLSSLQTIPLSFSTVSIHPDPTKAPIPDILKAISGAGFTAIELSWPNLVAHASTLNSRPVADDDYPTLVEAAKDVARRCAELKLEIILLQPFGHLEGWALDSPERKAAFARAAGWIDVMVACGGRPDLQVGSTDKANPPRAEVVRDLRELADMLAAKNLRMAYENWNWSPHAPGWREVWDIVREVDRDNVGLCLDTFQTAGGEWGDPTTKSGRIEHQSREEVERRWKQSMDDFAATVPADKIFLLQVSDAYRYDPPLEDKDVGGYPPRGRWSHGYRPLVGEGRGYLPCADFAKAVSKTGFRGWWSYEVFDWPAWETEEYNQGRDIYAYALRAKKGHDKFLKEEVAEDQ